MTILSAVTVAFFLITIVITTLLVNNPWLGLQLNTTLTSSGLELNSINTGGPADKAGLKPGKHLVKFESISGEVITLSDVDKIDDPSLLSTYDEYRSFFKRQAVIDGALRSGPVKLHFSDGETASLQADASRPIRHLPPIYWFQIICAYAALITGFLVLAFNPNTVAPRYYSLASIGMALLIFTNAFYSSRELSLDADLFRVVSKLSWLGDCFIGWGLLGTIWYYPKPINQSLFGPMLLGIFIITVFFLDYFEIPESLDFGQRYIIYLSVAMGAVLAWIQWQRSNFDPVSRASLRWFLICFFSVSLYITFAIIPAAYGFTSPINYNWAIGLLPLLQIGIALGIVRYRLFDIDQLSLRIWLWFLGGLLVIIVDSMLVYLVKINSHISLSFALVLVGWIYFPMRQWLWGSVGWNSTTLRLQEIYPELLKSVLSLSPHRPAGQVWMEILSKLFSPLAVREIPFNGDRPQIFDHGLSMKVAAFENVPAIEIYGANRGKRLMNPGDEEMVAALRQLFIEVLGFRKAYEQGVFKERGRVARDLHDDIASDLLGLIYSAPDTETRRKAQAIFNELRVIIQGMESHNSTLRENLDQWRADTEQRCDKAGIDVVWNDSTSHQISLEFRDMVNLRRALREAVSNVIRHSRATRLTIDISILVMDDDRTLSITLNDNGIGFDATSVSARGIANIRNRMSELGGEAEWNATPRKGTRLDLMLPMGNTQAAIRA